MILPDDATPKPDGIFGKDSDVELMAEKKVLDFKPAWGLEQIGYEKLQAGK